MPSVLLFGEFGEIYRHYHHHMLNKKLIRRWNSERKLS